MKLKFENGNVAKYSFRELEYGLFLLNKELDRIEKEMSILSKHNMEAYKIDNIRNTLRKPIEEKIKIVEDEIMNRMLTGNDDGVIERELLGVGCE